MSSNTCCARHDTLVMFSHDRTEVQNKMEQVYQAAAFMDIRPMADEEDDFDIDDYWSPESPVLDVNQLIPSLTLNMSHEAGWTSVYHGWLPTYLNTSTPIKTEEEEEISDTSTILYSDSELSLYDVTPEPQAQPDLLDV